MVMISYHLSFNCLRFIFLFLFSFVQVEQTQNVYGNQNNYDYMFLYDKLINLQPDPTKEANVQNISFVRDVARFELREGKMYLLNPIFDRTVGAIFLGKGTVYMTPPTQIEQKQLYRFYETDSLEEEFTVLFLLFADSTLEEFEKKLSFKIGKPTREVGDHLQYCLKFLSEDKGKYFDTSVLKFIFENEKNNYFYAHFSKIKEDPMCFRIDPYEDEEVLLMRRTSTHTYTHDLETVCQFHVQPYYHSSMNLDDKSKDLIKVKHYAIESTITNNLDFSAITEMEFIALVPGQNWIYFNLFSDMIVDSAFWEGGKKVTYFKHQDNPILWICCDTTLNTNSIYRLKLFYHGDLIDQDESGWIYIKNSLGWYPYYGTRVPATFELIFHTPKDYKFISVGKNMFTEAEKDMILSQWMVSKPIRNASFNLGYYKAFEIKDEKIPPVTIYISEGGHTDIGHELVKEGILSGKDMEKQVGADVANSLAFFQYVFGPSLMEQFSATETPYLHGLAFPGLIHLAWTTFQRTDDEGYDEIFRAHEVAHQWWGIGVDFKTYHDQWLSEGFATYAGLWYMQTARRDNEKFFNALKKYRESILSNRKYFLGSGQEAGPIWLGHRTSSSETKEDYDLIIYRKGAWVLHMLRNMMLDLKNMNEDAYINMLRDFYQTYRGKKASTQDFQVMVEKHIGGDMNWFFKQWIYETDVPTYYYSFKVEKQQDGKYLVRCRVRQEDVAEDFKMYMNLKVDFGDERYAYLRIFIEGPETDIVLPLMPFKPNKFEFNALESVLCKVEEEKWIEK